GARGHPIGAADSTGVSGRRASSAPTAASSSTAPSQPSAVSVSPSSTTASSVATSGSSSVSTAAISADVGRKPPKHNPYASTVGRGGRHGSADADGPSTGKPSRAGAAAGRSASGPTMLAARVRVKASAVDASRRPSRVDAAYVSPEPSAASAPAAGCGPAAE